MLCCCSWEIRACVGRCRTLVKELVGRYRSQRYFEAVRDVQANLDNAKSSNVAISSACGHTGSRTEVAAAAKLNKCIEPSCSAHLQSTNIVTADSLGVDAVSGNFGVKLETLVDLVESVPRKDKILIFVQFDDLFDKVRDALHAYDIKTTFYHGGAKAKSDTLETFQDPRDTDERILILNVADASAAGANLTVANHAFFISPLLTDTVQQYNAQMTQAIGRIRRYGQTKKVKIYHLLTADTQDVTQYVRMTRLNPDDVITQFNAEHGTRILKDPKAPKRERVNEPLDLGAGTKGNKGKKGAGALQAKKKAPFKSKDKTKADSDSDSDEDADEEDSAEESDGSDVEVIDAPVAPRATSSRAAAVKATAKTKKAVLEDSDIDVDEDDEPVKSRPIAKAGGKKRVVQSDWSDSDDEAVQAALSPKKAKTSPAPSKAKAKAAVTPAKSTKSSPSTSPPTSTWTPILIKDSAKKIAPSSDTKSKATPSKQGALSSFFKRASGDALESSIPAKRVRVSVEPPALTASQRKAFNASNAKKPIQSPAQATVASPTATPNSESKALVSVLSAVQDSPKASGRTVRFENAETEVESESETKADVEPEEEAEAEAEKQPESAAAPVVVENDEVEVVDEEPAAPAGLAAVAEDVEMAEEEAAEPEVESPSTTLVESEAGDAEDVLALKLADVEEEVRAAEAAEAAASFEVMED